MNQSAIFGGRVARALVLQTVLLLAICSASHADLDPDETQSTTTSDPAALRLGQFLGARALDCKFSQITLGTTSSRELVIAVQVDPSATSAVFSVSDILDDSVFGDRLSVKSQGSLLEVEDPPVGLSQSFTVDLGTDGTIPPSTTGFSGHYFWADPTVSPDISLSAECLVVQIF